MVRFWRGAKRILRPRTRAGPVLPVSEETAPDPDPMSSPLTTHDNFDDIPAVMNDALMKNRLLNYKRSRLADLDALNIEKANLLRERLRVTERLEKITTDIDAYNTEILEIDDALLDYM